MRYFAEKACVRLYTKTNFPGENISGFHVIRHSGGVVESTSGGRWRMVSCANSQLFSASCIQWMICVCKLSICGRFLCVFGYIVRVWLNTLTLVVQIWIPVRSVCVYAHLGSSGDLIGNLASTVTGSMIYLGTPLNNTKVISIFFFLNESLNGWFPEWLIA